MLCFSIDTHIVCHLPFASYTPLLYTPPPCQPLALSRHNSLQFNFYDFILAKSRWANVCQPLGSSLLDQPSRQKRVKTTERLKTTKSLLQYSSMFDQAMPCNQDLYGLHGLPIIPSLLTLNNLIIDFLEHMAYTCVHIPKIKVIISR